jgi:hypothetical protein
MAEIPSSCPRCGAKNTAGAWMCWRCNTALVAPPAPLALAMPVPSLPAQPSIPPPQLASLPMQAPASPPGQAALVAADYDLSLLSPSPRRQVRSRQPVLWAMAVASLALLIVTPVVMKGILPTNSVSELPSSIGGYTRVDNDPAVNRAKDELAKAALQEGASATAAVYRQAGKGLVVEVYTGMSAELTASDLLGTLAENLQSQARTTIVMAKATRTYGENGITQACAPMTGDLTGGVCYWADLKKVGLIMGINADVTETASLADEVRQSVSD